MFPFPVAFFDDGKVRPEYNFAKFSDKIFLPYQSKRLHETRRIPEQQQLFRDPEENPRIDPSCITIEPIQGGQTGSTTTWKVLLGLFRLWEIKGKPQNGKMRFSARELADILNLKIGQSFSALIQRELSILKSVLYTWEYSFRDENGETVDLIHQINVLSSSSYVSKNIEEILTSLMHYTQLHSMSIIWLICSLDVRFRFDFQTFVSIKSGSSLTLYSHLCTVLSGKSRYERTAVNLFNDLELIGTKYSAKRHRKTKLQGLINGLDGKSMASGY